MSKLIIQSKHFDIFLFVVGDKKKKHNCLLGFFI